ncbi:hypothetical protein YC2023_061366 [Brassica napus]
MIFSQACSLHCPLRPISLPQQPSYGFVSKHIGELYETLNNQIEGETPVFLKKSSELSNSSTWVMRRFVQTRHVETCTLLIRTALFLFE